MSENRYFQEALANFTHETASGGAIRHLADLGYTAEQIAAQLDFPTPYERVQKTMWEHLVDTGVIRLEEPGSGRQSKKAVYVQEYDRHGKTTFRRVADPEGEEPVTVWKERQLSHGVISTEEISALLSAKTAENGESHSYISVDFGLARKRDSRKYQQMLDALDGRQRSYIDGLPWERKRVYHRLDARMMGIWARLYGAGLYEGECCFIKTKEKVKLVN